MKVDFSDLECSNCCRIRNTQETEPSNEFRFRPVQVPGDDSASASIGSTSTSSLTTTPSAPVVTAPVSSGLTNTDSGGLVGSTPSGSASTQGPSVGFGVLTVPASTQPPATCSDIFRAPTESVLRLSQPSAIGYGLFSAPTPSRSFSNEPMRSLIPNSSGFGLYAASTPTLSGSMQAPVQASSASASYIISASSPIHSSPPFGFPPAVTSLEPKNFGSGAFTHPRSPLYGSMQAPVQASVSTTNISSPFHSSSPFTVSTEPPQSLSRSIFCSGPSGAPASLFEPMQAPVQATTPVSVPFSTASPSPFGNGVAFGRPDVAFLPPASNQSTSTIVFGTTPVSVSSLFGPTTSGTPVNPFSSRFAGFGGGGGSVSPFGYNTATTTLSPSIPSFGNNLSASRELSRATGEGSRHPRYAPTPDLTPTIGSHGGNGHLMLSSISASDSYRHKSHEELRWEDYQHGDKGGSFPAAHISPLGPWPNAFFTPSTVSPSMFPTNMNGPAFGPFRIDATTSSSSGFPLFTSSSLTSSTTIPAPPVISRPHETTNVSPTNCFGPIPSTYTPFCGGGGSVSPFGYNAATTTLPPSIPNFGSRYLPYFGESNDGRSGHMISISASDSYKHKSHEELRWEDYNHANQGSRNIFDYPPRTTQGNMTSSAFGPIPADSTISFSTSSTTIPAAPTVSSPSSGCTACGAKSSPSPTGYSIFNLPATTPPSAATSLPGMFFSTSGSFPMMFGTTTPPSAAQGTTPALQAYPVMFGTNLSAQGTTPATQAYPVQGFILLPFAAMNLQ